MAEETTTEVEAPEVEEAPGAPATAAASHGAEEHSGRGARKVRDGIVVSDKMDKTVVVLVERRVKHPKYHKTVTRSKKFKAHDESNDAAIGDRVRIVETRPLSKDKHFRLQEILERAK